MMRVSLKNRLRLSLRSGLLFGRADEPLDDYGKRIVRVILAELESGATVAAVDPVEERSDDRDTTG